jgi:hypothetical protein
MNRPLMSPFRWAALHCVFIAALGLYGAISHQGKRELWFIVATVALVGVHITRCIKAVHDKLEQRP